MFEDLAEKFEKINFTKMDDVRLTSWLRSNSEVRKMSLSESLKLTKLIRKAYQLGHIRDKVTK